MSTTLPATDATMTAVVKESPGPDGVRVTTVPGPAVPAGLAKVRVTATGICGTDVLIAHDEYGHEAPVVMGHEITGEVVEVGADSDQDWIGRTVACETYFSACETCRWCHAGRRNLCPRRRSPGSYEHGGFAEFVVLPTVNLHALPDGVGVEGALAEPLACVTHCLLDPPVLQAGDQAFIFSWNNFMFALVLSGSNTKTLPVAVFDFVSYASIDWGAIMAATCVMTLPIVVIALFGQKYFVSGLTAGATKG